VKATDAGSAHSTLTQLSMSKKKTGFSFSSAMVRANLSVERKERWVYLKASPLTGLAPWHHVSEYAYIYMV
jgi:hypothetical protein